ncbi:MAG TPA: carbohydrate-binding family 9-like protein [Phycisphaerae bacterium]|nr:carbohydrate-binding family 9-like protein [Phycisphaerae bacterium]
MLREVFVFSLLMGVGFIAGCANDANNMSAGKTPDIDALYTAVPVNVDGKLDDPVWKNAKAYSLSIPCDRAARGESLKDAGEVRFAWDNKYLYIAGKFTDSDIQANGTENGMHHYNWGDLMEVFLWPSDFSWYWELYVTPMSKKSTFFFPAKSYLGMASCYDYTCELTVAAQYKGTLNKWGDVDMFWTAEMAVPVSELTKRGEKFGPGANWRILVGRYNYSVYIDRQGPELSSFPKLGKPNYHLCDEYGRVVFVK